MTKLLFVIILFAPIYGFSQEKLYFSLPQYWELSHSWDEISSIERILARIPLSQGNPLTLQAQKGYISVDNLEEVGIQSWELGFSQNPLDERLWGISISEYKYVDYYSNYRIGVNYQLSRDLFSSNLTIAPHYFIYEGSPSPHGGLDLSGQIVVSLLTKKSFSAFLLIQGTKNYYFTNYEDSKYRTISGLIGLLNNWQSTYMFNFSNTNFTLSVGQGFSESYLDKLITTSRMASLSIFIRTWSLSAQQSTTDKNSFYSLSIGKDF